MDASNSTGHPRRSRPRSMETPVRDPSRTAVFASRQSAIQPIEPAQPAQRPALHCVFAYNRKKPHAVKTQCYLAKAAVPQVCSSKLEGSGGPLSHRLGLAVHGLVTRRSNCLLVLANSRCGKATTYISACCTISHGCEYACTQGRTWTVVGLCRWQLLSRRD